MKSFDNEENEDNEEKSEDIYKNNIEEDNQINEKKFICFTTKYKSFIFIN